jgi:LL-diaminopimelate aminotransferase
MNDRLAQLQQYPMEALRVWKAELERRGGRVFDFGTGDPREPTPPVLRRALVDGLGEVSQYPPTRGTAALRRAVAGYLQRRFRVAVEPDTEVLATLGSKECLFHLPMTFVQVPSDKDLVLYGEPAYPVYEIAALFAEAWTYSVPLSLANGYALDPDGLPRSVLQRASVVFLNYPHNPTGFCLPDALYRRWVELREEYGFVLVSDECYVDLHHEGPPPRSLLEFGRKGCLAVHSLSKRSGMTGYRSGFVAGDAELIDRYARFRASMGTAPQEFVQAAAAVAWTEPGHVRERVAVFGEKRRVLLDLFTRLGLRVHGSQAGLYLWVEVPPDTDGEHYAARCREAGILIAPGSFFGKDQQRFVRLALVPTVDECKAAAAAWPR